MIDVRGLLPFSDGLSQNISFVNVNLVKLIFFGYPNFMAEARLDMTQIARVTAEYVSERLPPPMQDRHGR